MELWRLRIEASHTPGQLAEIANALAGVGANIVSLDVHAVDATTVADEVVVAMTVPVDAPSLALALGPLDAVLVDLRPADHRELVDPVAHAVEAAGNSIRQGTTRASLGAAIRRVVRADIAFVRPALDGLALAGAAATALAGQRPVLAQETVKRLGGEPGGAWILAVPAVLDDRPHVAVVVRRSPRFSFTETARLQAVLGIAAVTAARDPSNGTAVRLDDGGAIVVRPLAPGDEGAVARMHKRCHPQTLYRRYFSKMTELSPTLLRMLMSGDQRAQAVTVAAVGSELVGIAHVDRSSPSRVEIAMLVEDAHQRRGVGSALLHACVRDAAARGVATITAICQTDNPAFPRLVARCGFPLTSTYTDDLRELSFPTSHRAGTPDSVALPTG